MVTAEELQSLLASHAGPFTSVEVPSGWTDLVADCHKQLVQIYPDYRLSQVKEKFGGLRYYVGPIPTFLSAQFYSVVRQFEDQSFSTCQVCGEPGRLLIIGNWYYTLCEADEQATREWRKDRWE